MADIVDTAIAAGTFKTLVAAVQAAGLVDTLKGDGPFTVFAPADEAFAKLPKGTVESLLEDKPKLTSILTYHVVSGAVKAADVVAHKNITTLQGQDLKIDSARWHLHKTVKVNDADIVKADIEADNGVMHVIDKVLMPSWKRRTQVAFFSLFQVFLEKPFFNSLILLMVTKEHYIFTGKLGLVCPT